MEQRDLLPLKEAIKICGSQEKLGEAIGWSQDSISIWLREKKGIVPAEAAPKIELATEGKITAHMLRPDIFPPTSGAPASP